jgi:hypothetical protein
MPTPSRKRVLKPYQRRAIVLFAGCGAAGCAEEVMLAHGFTFQQLAELVREGFAVATTERIVGGGQTFEDARFKITGAGRQTLGGQNDGPGA